MAFLNNNQWISMAFWYILWCVKEWGSRWVPQVGLPPWCHFQLVPGTAAATADGGPATPLAFGAIWSCGTVFSQVFFFFVSIYRNVTGRLFFRFSGLAMMMMMMMMMKKNGRVVASFDWIWAYLGVYERYCSSTWTTMGGLCAYVHGSKGEELDHHRLIISIKTG